MDAVYLDNNATTCVSPVVMDAMLPFFTEHFHNSSSVAGEAVGLRKVIALARRRIARLIDLEEPEECIFTSGATEANNWAVYGIGDLSEVPGHAITTELEHPSILEALNRLQSRGWTVSILPPDIRGIVTTTAVLRALRQDTRLLSVMLANNETGILQPVGEISSAVKAMAPAVFIHSDVTQAAGKTSVSLREQLGAVDLV